MVDTFFDAAVKAIQREENELNNLFNLNAQYYKKQHHGVCNLYETTFVYIIFKELLRQQYNHAVFWEYPYPSNIKEHCDLALLDKDSNLEALIEFKLWISDDDRKIKADISKLQKEESCNKYIFIIGYGGDIEENEQYLLRDNAPLERINKIAIKTKYFKCDTGKVEDNALNLFMYRVK